jgi:hypothetical protein
MNFADGVTAKPGAAGSDKKSDQQLHTILENLGRVAHQDDLHSGFTPRLDMEALERKAIYDRLGDIESQIKRRGSGGFVRYLVGILIGVATTLAWQSWTKPLADHENTTVRPSALETPQAATVAQTAPETVASKAPAAASLDPEQMQQLTRRLTTLQQTADQMTAAQDEMKRAIVNLASGVVEVLVRLPAPPPSQPPAAPAHKPTPTAPSSSRAAIPPRPAPRP